MSNSISENLEVERDETLDARIGRLEKDRKTRAEGRGAGPEVGKFRAEGDMRSVHHLFDVMTLAIAPLRD